MEQGRMRVVVKRLKEIESSALGSSVVQLSVFTKAPVFTLSLHLTTAAGTLHFIGGNELGWEDEWCFAWVHDKEIPACDAKIRA